MQNCGFCESLFLEEEMLNKEYIDIIVKRKNEILEELEYGEEIIRDDIFKLLRKKSRIVFFPLEQEKDLDGFHIEKTLNGEIVAFVYINTAKNYEKCIFCGAHELGHIYKIEKDIKAVYPDVDFNSLEIDEIMNRFAAEMLMPKEIFIAKFKEFLHFYRKDKSIIRYAEMIKVIIALMDYFYVPYKAVVWRLWEIEFLTLTGRQKFENIEKEDSNIIDAYIFEGKYTRLRHPTKLKSFENLLENLTYAEQNKIYSKRRIEEMRNDFEIDISVSGEKIAKTESDKLDMGDITKEYR